MSSEVRAWAESLVAVRAGGTPLAELPGLVDDEQGYAVQAEVLRTTGPLVGHKLAFTLADPPATGLARAPAHGVLVADQIRPSGTLLPAGGDPLVECELVVRAREPLTPDMDAGALVQRMDVAAGIEVPVARFRSWWPADGAPRLRRAEFIADACLAAHLIVGDEWRPAAELTLSDVAVALTTPEGAVLEGRGGAVMGDPLRAVAWFVADVGGVPAGHLIATGTMTPAVRARAGEYVADVSGLGRVAVSFGE